MLSVGFDRGLASPNNNFTGDLRFTCIEPDFYILYDNNNKFTSCEHFCVLTLSAIEGRHFGHLLHLI